MTKFTYTLNSGCLKCDGEYIEVGDKLDLTLLPQPSLPVWASEIRVIVTDVFSNSPTSLELEYDESLLGGYLLGSCNINGLPKCVDCCTELFEITEDHEERIVALEAKVDNDTTYTITASPDNLGATSYTITLTGSDGTTSNGTVNVGADSVIVGGTYTPSGGTITVPIQQMSTGGTVVTVGFVNLDVSSFQTGSELVLDTVTINANGEYVFTNNLGQVIDTVPTESFNATTGILTLTGGTQIDLNSFSSPDNGNFSVTGNNAGVYTISHTSSSGGAPQTGIIDVPSVISDSITQTPANSCPAELEPVYLATDIAGNKSFQYGSSPIPSGYQQVADVIGGFTVTNIDETTNIISPIQQSANPNVDYYEIASETITFSTSDFCLLGKAGKDINILSEINYAYSIDAANDTVNPQQYVYQLGQRILVNGVEVEIDGDNMAMNTSGHHDVIANTILGQWTTDGNNMVVTVQVYVRAQRLGIYNVGDRILTDMIQIGVTMELDQ